MSRHAGPRPTKQTDELQREIARLRRELERSDAERARVERERARLERENARLKEELEAASQDGTRSRSRMRSAPRPCKSGRTRLR